MCLHCRKKRITKAHKWESSLQTNYQISIKAEFLKSHANNKESGIGKW